MHGMQTLLRSMGRRRSWLLMVFAATYASGAHLGWWLHAPEGDVVVNGVLLAMASAGEGNRRSGSRSETAHSGAAGAILSKDRYRELAKFFERHLATEKAGTEAMRKATRPAPK